MPEKLEVTQSADNKPYDKYCRKFGDFEVDRYTSAPLQLIQYALIPRSQEEVFALVSHHEGMAEFSFVLTRVVMREKNDTTLGTETPVRFCQTPVGFVLKEAIVGFQPPYMYAYSILNANVLLPNHLGLVHIEKLSGNQSLLIWRNYFSGRAIGGVFARVSLSAILPDLVSNMANHLGGKMVDEQEARQRIASPV